jgi:hypothetical protein
MQGSAKMRTLLAVAGILLAVSLGAAAWGAAVAADASTNVIRTQEWRAIAAQQLRRLQREVEEARAEQRQDDEDARAYRDRTTRR